jgi:hypothetical protein
VLINIIMGTMCNIVYISYNYVLFKGMFIKFDVHRFFPILDESMKLFDIATLYYFCPCTEKEIRIYKLHLVDIKYCFITIIIMIIILFQV